MILNTAGGGPASGPRPDTERRANSRAGAALAVLLFALNGGCSDGTESASVPEPASRVSSDAADAAIDAASEYFHTRDLVKAEAILNRLIDQSPRDPRARELYGQVLLARAADAREQDDQTRFEELQLEAYTHYEALLELQPDVAGLHQSAGQLAQMIGRDEAALTHYRRAIELAPLDPQPRFFAAQVLLGRGDHDEATAMLERVLTLAPEHALARASLASIAAERGAFDSALASIRAARELQPDDVDFRVIEASILRQRGEPRQAIERLIGLSAEVRARFAVAREIATGYAAIGDHEAAAEAWVNCFREHSGEARAWRAAVGAAEQQLAAGQREQAWTWLQQARLLAPDEPRVRELESRLSRDRAEK